MDQVQGHEQVAATRLPGKRVLRAFFSQWKSACGAQRQSPVALQLRIRGNLPGSSQFKRSFRAWKLYARFMVAHKIFRKQGRTRRKEILLEKLRKAENAANSHLPGELYKAIRDIAPKRKREKVQIRSVEGKLLNVNEEMAEIQLHCQNVFGAGSFCVDASAIDPLCIEAAEVSAAIKKSQTGSRWIALRFRRGKPAQPSYPTGLVNLQTLIGVKVHYGIHTHGQTVIWCSS